MTEQPPLQCAKLSADYIAEARNCSLTCGSNIPSRMHSGK